MPELPDVEVFRRYLASTALHKRIETVKVMAESLLEGVSAEKLEKNLVGNRFRSAHRHGKQLFAETDEGPWLGLHFGMTGYLKYFSNEEKRPDYERMVVDFTNGYHLSYACPRKLGKIRLIDDLNAFIEKKGLGPDALDETLDLKAFREMLNGTRASVKSALMNQTWMAGIGNVYSDEILFQSAIYPKTRASDLDEHQTEALYRKMHTVLEASVEHGADPGRLPGSYLIPQRRKDGKCPRCGRHLRKLKVSGRSGYYCEQCQSKD